MAAASAGSPLLPHPPGEGPVHGTRVEVEETEAARQGPGYGALAGSGGTIDGNDRGAGHQKTVINQATGAAVDGRSQQREATGVRHRNQPVRVHNVQVVGREGGRPEAFGHGGDQRGGAFLP